MNVFGSSGNSSKYCFHVETASGFTGGTLTGYESLYSFPGNTAEDNDSIIINSADGKILMENYITIVGEPNIDSIEPGEWQLNIYANVDNLVNTSELLWEIWKRSSGGTETFCFSGGTTGDINTINPTIVNPCSNILKRPVKLKSIIHPFNID